MKYKRIKGLLLLIFCISLNAQSQEQKIPEWFLNDMAASVGTWITDNSEYMSANEPFTHYGIEWTWGLGKTSLKGRLFGLIDGKERADFWEFRQYWDNVKQVAVVEQFGNGGMIGLGTLSPLNENTTESIQTFSMPDGRHWMDRHISVHKGSGELQTTSYKPGESEDWEENRTYLWIKKS